MRVQATGKYIVWENGKTLLYVVMGLLGIGIFLSLLTSLFNNNVQPGVSGLDMSILLMFMGVCLFTFNRKMDFTFQNSLSASARAWGVYLGYIAFAFGAFILILILVPVFTIALKAFAGEPERHYGVFSLSRWRKVGNGCGRIDALSPYGDGNDAVGAFTLSHETLSNRLILAHRLYCYYVALSIRSNHFRRSRTGECVGELYY